MFPGSSSKRQNILVLTYHVLKFFSFLKMTFLFVTKLVPEKRRDVSRADCRWRCHIHLTKYIWGTFTSKCEEFLKSDELECFLSFSFHWWGHSQLYWLMRWARDKLIKRLKTFIFNHKAETFKQKHLPAADHLTATSLPVDTPLNADWFLLVVLTFHHKYFLTRNRHSVNEVLQDHWGETRPQVRPPPVQCSVYVCACVTVTWHAFEGRLSWSR